ncbi:HlyC/CorC family transporter [Verrucosispora sp. CWR15]|uniref:HlyC/CorC family transporter n=1 Tax=Verrucosispora sioxanthis TaxID=2499994 RepID=A0A6M1KV06_9ACTN|nr:hemolysin family protein [Verrucosispora sioxanthis]NEE62072.1 HlyC/CorC family transporter [Verrucosispora sioxanthis]NGM11182.1 HlyC/CorC family transporter [Verrucosispora sioxanthis]
MQSYWSQLALVAVLIVVNAIFAGSELALVSLRDSQVQRLERSGRTGRVLARLARDPNRFLATIQIGITLAGFLASAAAAVSLAKPLVPLLDGVFGRAAGPISVVLVTLVLTFVTLVFGELAPKRIAMQVPERWALLVARPLDLLAAFTRPVVWVLGATSDLVVRLVGLDPKPERDEISPDELRDIVAGHHGFTKEQQTIIAGAVEIAERRLRAVLVPRLRVFCLDSGTTAEAARLVLAASGHSRAPVVRHGGLDDSVGVIHLRDLVGVGDDQPVDEYARPPLLLPDSVPVVDALRRFKAERQHMALVVDERGAVEGIVTLEDILEEIVGEIYDETDRDVGAVRTDADGALLLPGTFPVHDLPDIGVELPGRPDGDYTTVAGLLLAGLGRIPHAGEQLTVDGWRLEVTLADDRAVSGVRLRRTATGPADPDAAETTGPAAPEEPEAQPDDAAGPPADSPSVLDGTRH